MDASLRLRSVQHDKVVSFRTLFFVIPSESEESSAMWMLHCACAPFSMTSAVSFRTLFFVIPSESEESSAMRMLHFAQHDKVVSFRTQ